MCIVTIVYSLKCMKYMAAICRATGIHYETTHNLHVPKCQLEFLLRQIYIHDNQEAFLVVIKTFGGRKSILIMS